MLASIHVGELGWKRRLDLEAKTPGVGEIWQAPEKDGLPGRIKAFGQGRRPNILTKMEDELAVPNYTGW